MQLTKQGQARLNKSCSLSTKRGMERYSKLVAEGAALESARSKRTQRAVWQDGRRVLVVKGTTLTVIRRDHPMGAPSGYHHAVEAVDADNGLWVSSGLCDIRRGEVLMTYVGFTFHNVNQA